MAGCTFDSNNYVSPFCNGFAVVVNGQYVACTGSACSTCNGHPIFLDLTTAQNTWNQLEGCGGGGGGGCSAATCPAPNSCVNGVCTPPGPPPPGGGTCPVGQINVFGKCYPQGAVLAGGAVLLLFLLRRK